jgi:hypothetical protein
MKIADIRIRPVSAERRYTSRKHLPLGQSHADPIVFSR